MLRSTLASAESGMLTFSMRLLRNCTFAVLVAVGALLALTRVTEPLELRVLDSQFELLRTWFPRPAPEIVIVGIDHDSLERIPEPFALWHRHFIAFLLAQCAANALVVGLGVVVPVRSASSYIRKTRCCASSQWPPIIGDRPCATEGNDNVLQCDGEHA